MTNSNGGRICPKCGMNLGQRHLCPVCDQAEENTEARPDSAEIISAEEEALHASPAIDISPYLENVSRVIEFIGEYPDDWDNEFNTFFDELPGNQDYVECYDTCSRVSRIIPKDKPVAGKIPGSMTINVMQGLKTVFPDLSDGEARELAMRLLGMQKRAESTLAPLPPGSSAEIMELYRKATNENDAEAQFLLGRSYQNGSGVPKDMTEALKWYRKAADQGNASAQVKLGFAYQEGNGVIKDNSEAAKWFRLAAEQGNPIAQAIMGYYYKLGNGVIQDEAEAVKWFRLAAEQGDAKAQYSLGNCYLSGQGVSENKPEAVKWFRLAAEQGDAKAQSLLGLCLFFGKGVSEDKAEAVKWVRKAVEQGDTKAQMLLNLMPHLKR